MTQTEDETRRFLKRRLKFTDKEIARVEQLAALRGEALADTVVTTLKNLTRVIPKGVRPHNFVTNMPVRDIALVDDLVRVEMENGRVLWNFPSRERYRNLYYVFRDRLPKMITPDTYGPYYDVYFRYLAHQRTMLLPRHAGAVLIDCGAYIGWKALGYHDNVVERAKVIAIEMSGQQHAMIERNVEANNLQGSLIPVRCGVWNEAGIEMAAEYQHYASHSLRPPDEHKHYTRQEKVFTETLDNIIDKYELDVVDYLNVQTNGTEQQAVMGLERNFDRVKMIYIGAHYKYEGVPQADTVVAYLKSRGCQIVQRNKGAITAVTPKWIDAFTAPEGYKIGADGMLKHDGDSGAAMSVPEGDPDTE